MLATMAIKKPTGGKHTTERKPVQLPLAWLKLARKLAATHKQPTVWLIQQLLSEEAKRQGFEHPTPPWETTDDAD